MCSTKSLNIKIYPEWNVNVELRWLLVLSQFIKIYPEWNVNRITVIGNWDVARLKSIQSGM